MTDQRLDMPDIDPTTWRIDAEAAHPAELRRDPWALAAGVLLGVAILSFGVFRHYNSQIVFGGDPYGTYNEFARAAGLEQEFAVSSKCWDAGSEEAQYVCSRLQYAAADAAKAERASREQAAFVVFAISGALAMLLGVGAWVRRRKASNVVLQFATLPGSRRESRTH